METVFESVLEGEYEDAADSLNIYTHQIPLRHSSLLNTTAHMASSPLLPGPAAALSFPLSPTTSASIPLSTIPKSIACTARLSLWFLVRKLAVRMSDRIVLRINPRRVDDVVLGSRGNRVCSKLYNLI